MSGGRMHMYPVYMCMHMHMQGVRNEWRAQLAGVEAEVSRLGLAKAEQSHVDRALDEKVCACAYACACACTCTHEHVHVHVHVRVHVRV